MSQPISMIAVLSAISLSVACGSDGGVDGAGNAGSVPAPAGGAAGTDEVAATGGMGGTADFGPLPVPSCASGDNSGCQPSGFPFVRGALAHSTACEGVCDPALATGTGVHFTHPETGKLCISGDTDANDTGILLGFTVFSSESLSLDYQKVLTLFNADLHGITHARFTLDDPPPEGVQVAADTLHSLECRGVDCITWGAALPNPVTESGVPTTVALVDFRTQTNQQIERRALSALRFDVGPGPFDFCVRDFAFLDADGVEVMPSP